MAQAASEIIGLKELPIDFAWLAEASQRKTARAGIISLSERRREFERNLYAVLLTKANGDLALVARFLDIPRATLAERIEELGCNLAD